MRPPHLSAPISSRNSSDGNPLGCLCCIVGVVYAIYWVHKNFDEIISTLLYPYTYLESNTSHPILWSVLAGLCFLVALFFLCKLLIRTPLYVYLGVGLIGTIITEFYALVNIYFNYSGGYYGIIIISGVLFLILVTLYMLYTENCTEGRFTTKRKIAQTYNCHSAFLLTVCLLHAMFAIIPLVMHWDSCVNDSRLYHWLTTSIITPSRYFKPKFQFGIFSYIMVSIHILFRLMITLILGYVQIKQFKDNAINKL